MKTRYLLRLRKTQRLTFSPHYSICFNSSFYGCLIFSLLIVLYCRHFTADTHTHTGKQIKPISLAFISFRLYIYSTYSVYTLITHTHTHYTLAVLNCSRRTLYLVILSTLVSLSPKFEKFEKCCPSVLNVIIRVLFLISFHCQSCVLNIVHRCTPYYYY